MKKLFALLLSLLLLFGSLACAEPARTEQMLKDGKYIIGENIAPGTYILTCQSTTGNDIENMSGQMSQLYEDTDWIALWKLLGALGNMYPTTVEIIGNYGEVFSEYDLYSGDSITLTLKEHTALRITDGTCTLTPKP